MRVQYEVCDRCRKEVYPSSWHYRVVQMTVKSFCGIQGVGRQEYLLCKNCKNDFLNWLYERK